MGDTSEGDTEESRDDTAGWMRALEGAGAEL